MSPLPEPACQLMLYCRAVAVMTEEEFLGHYQNKLSLTAKRQLRSFPAINSNPRSCQFPWNPAGTLETRQEPSPALSNSVPSDLVPRNLNYENPVQLIPNELPEQSTIRNSVEVQYLNPNGLLDPSVTQTQMGAENLNPNELQPSLNRRRRRSTESTPDSEESYVPPTTRRRIAQTAVEKTPHNEVILPTAPINDNSFEKVKRLLTRYSTKLKYQRYPDSRTNIRPCFETVNEYWMDLDVKLKKKKPLIIEGKANDLNSQRVKLIPGTPVIAMKGNKALAVIKGATFKVTKLNPLTVKDIKTKKVTVISPELFQDYFYVNFCTTSHKVQGQTIKEEFTVHEFKGMRKKMKYVALSRATNKNLINVCRTEYKVAKELPDTDFEKINKSQDKVDTPLESKRRAAIGVIHRIIKGQATEEYCIKHTGLNREALLSHLGIPDGIVWKGYELDHIKPRKLFVTDEDFEKINWYSNLRLLPRSSNNERNWLEK